MANQLGKWAFIIGALLAILLGILEGVGAMSMTSTTAAWLMLLLLVLGLVIGFVNITAKEVQSFLVASIAVLVAATSANLVAANTLFSPLGGILQAVVKDVVLVVAPAALIVALRAVYGFAAE